MGFTLETNTSDRADGNKNKPSVIAGQALLLDVTAIDSELNDRAAFTYSTDGVQVSTKDSDGNLVSAVSYSGTGVVDNENGSATLDGDTLECRGVRRYYADIKAGGYFHCLCDREGRRRCCEHYGGCRDYR